MSDEDELFAKELEKVLALSKLTAAEEERQRQKYAEFQGNITDPQLLSSRSRNNMSTPPAILPMDSTQRKQASKVDTSVRARPRPASSRQRVSSPIQSTVPHKRDGFVQDGRNDPFRTSELDLDFLAPASLTQQTPRIPTNDLTGSFNSSTTATKSYAPFNDDFWNIAINPGANQPAPASMQTSNLHPFRASLPSSKSNPNLSAIHQISDPFLPTSSSNSTQAGAISFEVEPPNPQRKHLNTNNSDLMTFSPQFDLDKLYKHQNHQPHQTNASNPFIAMGPMTAHPSRNQNIAASRNLYDPNRVADELMKNIQPHQVGSRMHLKRIMTPSSDLLDLSNDSIPIPHVSSMDIFDPLVKPPADSQRQFDEQVSQFNERLQSRPKYVAEEGDVYREESATINNSEEEAELHDPFSYEELSMALMTASTLKGNEMIDIEDEIESLESSLTYTSSNYSPPASTLNSQISETAGSTSSMKSVKVTGFDMMDEFTAFSVMVARLKSEYRHDDSYTNLGLLFSRTVSFPKPDQLMVTVTVNTQFSADSITVTVDVNTQVELLIWQLVEGIDLSYTDFSTDDYILKVRSRSEYLVNDSVLSDYAYVHECLKLSDPIRFSLHELKSIPKPFLRKPGDDEEPIYMIKYELHGDRSYKVQPRDLQILYQTFIKHLEQIQQASLEKGLSLLQSTGLIQSVKAITSVLIGAETIDIRNAVRRLQSVIDDANKYIYDESKFLQYMSDFNSAIETLKQSVIDLLLMYCDTFRVTYNPENYTKNKHTEVQDVTESLENILVQIGSVHQIPAKYRARFDSYKVIVSLFYAGRKVTEHTATEVFKISPENKLEDSIQFDQWLELTDFSMCMVPVETRLVFTLCAMNTTQQASGSGTNVPNKWINIGWVSMMLFDFKGRVVQGGKLLSFWHGTTSDATGTTSSNIWQPRCTLLQINLPDFGFDLKFPSPVESQSRPLTLYSDNKFSDAELIQIKSIQDKSIHSLSQDDKDLLWQHRQQLSNQFPDLLPKVLQSVPHFSYSGIHLVQDILDIWPILTAIDALTLLSPDYPCTQIRNYAVKCLKNISSDEMCDYLPQLVQCIKNENYHDSSLVRLLLERSITSVRLAQQLYWCVKDAAAPPSYRERYKLIFGGLVSVMGKQLREESENEERLVRVCNNIADKVKQTKLENRDKIMSQQIVSLSDILKQSPVRLPTDPGIEVEKVDAKVCTYFNSFTVPLKLVFKNQDESSTSHYLMFKVGDDLRQDMLVMQLIRLMDKIWIQNELDLKIVTFTCLPTSAKRGMVELINDCETLRKIQTLGGITGSFKDQPLANWLQKHNQSSQAFQKATENFTLSCAGYCVATYILGIGDRHNDNIMVKRSGHIFHIDFAKMLGSSQKFGNFKRDRTPFILTPDMAYVINGGDKPSEKFQAFIDLCCDTFNAIRENSQQILNLLSLVTAAGIDGVTSHAVDYVRNALLLNLTNTEATISFTRMIEECLSSRFVQLNFFIHNLGQLKFSGHSDGGLLSFVPTTYSLASDGRITSVDVFDYQKRYTPERHYIYIIKVHRKGQKDSTFVYRRYSEFQELYGKLVQLFPMASLPTLPGSILLGRTHVQKVAEKRKLELENFLQKILQQSQEISEHDIIYTFFHPMLRDEQEVKPEEAANNSFRDTASTPLAPSGRQIAGQVKLSMIYKQHGLHLVIMHVKNLDKGSSCNERGDPPNPYVKCYLLPDPIKTSKRKTKVVKSTFNPTYNELLQYRLSLNDARTRRLQISVWSAELSGNEYLGSAHINLNEVDLSNEAIAWYELSSQHHV